MAATVCKPARNAHPEATKVIGVAATHRNVNRGQVFRRVLVPRCRVVSLWPVSNAAFEAWRRQALLPWELRGMLKVWPVEATLLKGIQLGSKQNFEPWYAECCLNGFLNRDPKLVNAVSEMLKVSVGIVLGPIGERTTLIVAEDLFVDCVEIGEPTLIGEQESHFGAPR